MRIIGDPSLAMAPSWGSGGFTVQERGTLSFASVEVESTLATLDWGVTSLRRCTLAEPSALTVSGVASLNLGSMAVPAAALGVAIAQLSVGGSYMRLSAVTLPENPTLGELMGTITVGEDGSKTTDPSNPFAGRFVSLEPVEYVGNGAFSVSIVIIMKDYHNSDVIPHCGKTHLHSSTSPGLLRDHQPRGAYI